MIPILDNIPVNIFIIGTTLIAGTILFIILTRIPDEEQGSKEDRKKGSKE